MRNFKDLREKTLTPAEKKKREEIAKAMERENPGMDMRKKMAIATWQAKKVAEETKQIDELKKSTLASYVKKASTDLYLKGQDVQYHTNKAQKADGVFAKQSRKNHYDAADKALKKASNRDTGIGRAVNRLAKEEVDLDEGLYHVSYGVGLDHQVVAKDASDAHQKAMAHFKKTKPKLNDPKYSDTFNKKTITRIKGDEPRSDKYKTEEVEQVDEISRDLARRYIRKVADKTNTGELSVKQVMKRRPGVNLAGKKAYPGIAGEPRVRATEQVEDDMPASPDEKSMAISQAKFIEYVAEEIKEYLEKDKSFPEWMQNKLSSLHENAKDMHAVLAGDYEDEDEMEEAVQSADKKPEKYVRPDGKVDFRMIRQDKKVIKNENV